MAQDPNGAIDQAGVRFPPPLVFIGFLLIGLAVEPMLGWAGFQIGDVWRHGGGGVLVVLGLTLVFTANGLFQRAGTTAPPWTPSTTIVATGLYGITRNPMYLGMAIVHIGLAVMFDSVVAILLLPLALIAIHTQVIAREEAYLERKFGAAYLAYKAKVPRWL